MKKENFPVLELNKKTDLLAVQVKCPICGEKYLHGTPYVSVPCNKCGNTYRTDFKQDIYTKKARQLNSLIAYHNGLRLRVDEDYESSLMTIRQHFIEQHCYDVSEIKRTIEEYRRCFKCGVCFNCFTCKSCGKTFEKDKNKRKQTCPHCKSKNYAKSYFKEVFVNEKNIDIKLCPFCKSDNIRLTRTNNKSKCHLCGSRKLTDKKINIIFEITIKRKKAYRRENV